METMNGLAAVDFELARQVLQRGIAALFLLAFISTLTQFRPLAGEHGLSPAPRLIERAGDALRPSIFRWLRYTDRRLTGFCWGGIVISALLVIGAAAGWGHRGYRCSASWCCGSCTCRSPSIGGRFYGFGWEMLLCEAGFMAAFLGSDSPSRRRR
jgi:hypothetical protein